MVHKPVSLKGVRDDTFENDVKMYGTQAMQNTEQLQTQV